MSFSSDFTKILIFFCSMLHLNIGADSIIMAQAGVTKSFPERSIILGAPAVPRKDFIKQMKMMKSAEELVVKFKKYEHLLKALETDEE